MNMNRKSLFARRVAANKKLFDGTVPSNKTCLLELFSSRINLYIFFPEMDCLAKKKTACYVSFSVKGVYNCSPDPCQAKDVQI